MDNRNKNATGDEQGRVGRRLDYRVIVLHVANFIDAVCTLLAIDAGAKELNPFMDFALSHGPGVFLTVKMLVIAVSVEYLDKHLKEEKRGVLTLLMAIFLATVAWHLYGMVTIYGSS